MRFRSFQSRVMLLFLGLFSGVLILTVLLVNLANTRNARREVDAALEVGVGVFRRLIDGREERLIEAARLLSGDFAFKTAYATGERETVLSALENHRGRIGADVMLLLSLDYDVLADTRLPGGAVGQVPEIGRRIERAIEQGTSEAAAIVALDGVPYQLVVVPLLVPLPDAWICIGFRVDREFVEQFRRLALSHVTLLAESDGGTGAAWTASTLPQAARDQIVAGLGAVRPDEPFSATLSLSGERYVTRVITLDGQGPTPVVAVLQRSLAEALRPFLRLRQALLALLLTALALCTLAVMAVARSVTRPVLEIAEAAKRVERGDYEHRIEIDQVDEIGRLAESFNHMVRGLEERKRVRSLLGKVVSPAIARELLSGRVELGGEEREVSVLFADVRGFTAWCEGVAPAVVLERLNDYLNEMTQAIEAEDGVVDKYVGDSIMALFGAPVGRDDDAERAVRAALGMCGALALFNERSIRRGAPEIRAGIGINTSRVVAGNMGSSRRMNYTVIGDGVNVASRLERLTKRYGFPVLVSEATRLACGPAIVFREVDRVRVAGKREPLTIHEPIGVSERIAEEEHERIAAWEAALERYRTRDWAGARRAFTELADGDERQPAQVFLARIERFTHAPPDPGWDGVWSHDEK